MVDKKIFEYSEVLKKLGVENKILEHPASRNIDEVVGSLGKTRADSAATLVMKAGNRFVSIIRRDDCKLNTKKIKKLLGVDSLRIATDQEFIEITGLTPGAATYYNKNISSVFIDRKVLERQFIIGGSGDFSASISHQTSDLVKIPGSKIVDVCEISTSSTLQIDGSTRILSGITPSSTKGLHLGNYLGAVKPHIDFQNRCECFYFVANLHALNTVFHPDEVRQNTMNIFTEYLAFGIDPKKTTFYIQSDIQTIPYLQTILNNTVTIAELKRMHAYKDKLQKDVEQETVNFGLFSYPVLMAADILIFKPDVIPVGEDQSQHVEIAREIARTFNLRYGDALTIPELYVQKDVARVPGIYGERKMSKSLGNDIPIFGTENEIRKQIMSIKTDPARIHATDPGDPSKNTVFTYFELMEYDKVKFLDMKERYKKGSISDREIKDIFYDFFMEYFSDFRAKKEKLLQDKTHLHDLRVEGAKRANLIAEKTIERVRKAVGI